MKPSIEKVAIIGAGALGAAYGSILYEMDPRGVCFIASGARHDKLKRDGVVVNGKPYGIAVMSPEEATPADLLIVAVKHHHLDQAIGEMKKAVGPATTILSVMNGIDSEERIGAVYGKDKVVYGLTLGIDAVREGNSVNYKNQGRIFFGEAKNPEHDGPGPAHQGTLRPRGDRPRDPAGHDPQPLVQVHGQRGGQSDLGRPEGELRYPEDVS